MIKKLNDICSFVSGNAWKAAEFADEGIPIIRINNMNTNENDFVYWQGDYDKRYLINKGDLLVSLSGTIKTFQWDGPEALLNQRIVKVLANPDTNQDWVYYQISHVIEEIANKGKHAVIRNVSVNDLKNFEIDVPDFQIQNKIVAILDKARALVQKRKQTIDLLEKLIKNQFKEVFGDPTYNQKGFKLGTIRDLVKEVKYGTSSKAEMVGEIPYLRMNNLTYDGYLDLSDMKYISFNQNEKDKYAVRRYDLLFNRTNSRDLVGKTVVYDRDDEMVIAGYIIKSRVNDDVNPYFIWGYLNSDHGKGKLKSMCKSIVGMANINAQEFQNIPILLPSLELQNQFGQFVQKVSEKKKNITRSLHLINDIFNGLMQRAFSGKLNLNVSVELDALLEEIDSQKPENDLYSIFSNEEYVNNLVVRLNTQDFENQDLYDKAKHAAFQLLKTDEILSQKYDEDTKSLKLVVK